MSYVWYKLALLTYPTLKPLHKDSATVEKQDSFARKQLFNVDKYLKNSDYKPDKEKSKVNRLGDAVKQICLMEFVATIPPAN